MHVRAGKGWYVAVVLVAWLSLYVVRARRVLSLPRMSSVEMLLPLLLLRQRQRRTIFHSRNRKGMSVSVYPLVIHTIGPAVRTYRVVFQYQGNSGFR